jgi:hypothetical protein
MKKIIVFLIVSMLVITGFVSAEIINQNNHKKIIENINLNEPIISESDDFIELNFLETNLKLINSGKPSLPKITKNYLFPFGTKITDVIVTFSDNKFVELSKPVKASSNLKMISTIYSDIEVKYGEVDYSDIDIYPVEKYNFRKGAGLSNGEHVIFLSVNIYPIQYLPNTNTIIYSNNFEINIEYNEPYENVNFPDLYDYLIISPLEFKDELQPLVDYKNNDEVSTILVTLDEIPSVGIDEQESIKYYIKDAIEEMGIKYVLLVGAGVEGNEIFPVRYAWVPSGNYESYFPSDLYYADIYDGDGNFSNWDSDGDGKYAEFSVGMNTNDMDSVDMYPDVYLGKLPCNNEDEVSIIVDKIIRYEEHNQMLNNIVQIGGDTFPGDASDVNEGEFANGIVLEKLPGYESIKLWASESEGSSKLTKMNIANGFNKNVDFVDFSGHGSSASWATHAPSDDRTWLPPKSIISPYTGWLYIDYDLFLVSNEYKHPVVVFNACSCSQYSESDKCISWRTINTPAGGIASFGASGIGYGSYGVHEVERVWGWMEVHIFESLYNDKILGDVWANCLNGYINSFIEEEWDDADYKTILEMSLFGDPTLAIDDGKDPKSINTDINEINQFTIIKRLIGIIPILKDVIKNLTF